MSDTTKTVEEIAVEKEAKEAAAAKKKQESDEKAAADRKTLKDELMAEILAEMKTGGTTDVPAQATTQQIIIAQPVSEAEASESARLLEQKKQEAAANAWLEEKVPIKLFKDGKNYKDDLTISLNGETVRIMRGIPVMIKRKFAMLIEDSEQQVVTAAEFDQFEQDKYKNAVTAQAL